MGQRKTVRYNKRNIRMLAKQRAAEFLNIDNDNDPYIALKNLFSKGVHVLKGEYTEGNLNRYLIHLKLIFTCIL